MIQEGDIIEWNGACRVIRGKVIKDDRYPEGFAVQLPNGCTFQLADLRRAKSSKLIKQ